MPPGESRLLEGFSSRTAGVCVASGVGMRKQRGYTKGGGLFGHRERLRGLSGGL